MKKTKRRSGSLAITLFFAALTFAILLLFLLLLFLTVLSLVKTDVLSIVSSVSVNRTLLISLFILFCLLVGAGLSFLLSRILTGPINRVVEALDSMAAGNYKVRLRTGGPVGRFPPIAAAAESFNQMAQALDRTEIMHSDFINNFSHEFKTPIVSIAGFAKLLKRGDLTDEQRAEYVDIIGEESRRLSQMATGVLDLTKLESRDALGETSRFNLSEQIRNCVVLLEEKWVKKELEPELDFGEYYVRGDEDLLRQVWINLLDNAIKYADEGGSFGVGIVRSGGSLRVSVADKGKTIPPESLPYIFNKFYQADESHSAEGNGIGLAVAKKIISLHGGEISASSSDERTVFTVTLPED